VRPAVSPKPGDLGPLGTAGSPEDARGLNQEIANAVVRCHKRFLGKGPASAKAFYRHSIVVVVMWETLLEAERSLVAAGDEDLVLETRRRYHRTMRPTLIASIEALTDCKVEVAMSSNHVSPDMAVELFVLDRPVPGEPGDTREDGKPRSGARSRSGARGPARPSARLA
jgi:uncharacterized protein YbcI